jgi:hypothetical protein
LPKNTFLLQENHQIIEELLEFWWKIPTWIHRKYNYLYSACVAPNFLINGKYSTIPMALKKVL